MDVTKIISMLIRLLEDQENAKINYKITLDNNERQDTKETA